MKRISNKVTSFKAEEGITTIGALNKEFCDTNPYQRFYNAQNKTNKDIAEQVAAGFKIPSAIIVFTLLYYGKIIKSVIDGWHRLGMWNPKEHVEYKHFFVYNWKSVRMLMGAYNNCTTATPSWKLWNHPQFMDILDEFILKLDIKVEQRKNEYDHTINFADLVRIIIASKDESLLNSNRETFLRIHNNITETHTKKLVAFLNGYDKMIKTNIIEEDRHFFYRAAALCAYARMIDNEKPNDFSNILFRNQGEIVSRLEPKERGKWYEMHRKPGTVQDAFWNFVFKSCYKLSVKTEAAELDHARISLQHNWR